MKEGSTGESPATEALPEWACTRNPDTPVVTKVEVAPVVRALPPRQKSKIKVGEPLKFAFDVIVEPTSAFGKRAYVGGSTPGAASFEIYCNEGKVLGGEEDAPPPLAYFTAGAAFCLMTHITGYLRFTDLQISSLRLEMRGNYNTSLGHVERGRQGPGGCDSFESYLIVESEESPERLKEFIAICEDACVASQSLAKAVPTTVNLVLNGSQV